MRKINTILYSQVKFIWVSNHHDLHLDGICDYKNKIHRFKTIWPDWIEETEEWGEAYCKIYRLNSIEKLTWLYDKRKFELMVGYHWTNSYRKKDPLFYYRKPKKLYEWLFKKYYNMK